MSNPNSLHGLSLVSAMRMYEVTYRLAFADVSNFCDGLPADKSKACGLFLVAETYLDARRAANFDWLDDPAGMHPMIDTKRAIGTEFQSLVRSDPPTKGIRVEEVQEVRLLRAIHGETSSMSEGTLKLTWNAKYATRPQ